MPRPPALRGLVAVAVTLAWFGSGGPALARWLESTRVTTTRQASVSELRIRAGATPSASVQTLLDAATRASAKEAAWGRNVAGLLTAAEREEGLTRAASLPPIPATGLPTLLEPEVLALVIAIQARYGPATAPLAHAPLLDAWNRVDRRSRARALLALVQAGSLEPERAAMALGTTLDLLEAQHQRSQIETELREILGD